MAGFEPLLAQFGLGPAILMCFAGIALVVRELRKWQLGNRHYDELRRQGEAVPIGDATRSDVIEALQAIAPLDTSNDGVDFLGAGRSIISRIPVRAGRERMKRAPPASNQDPGEPHNP